MTSKQAPFILYPLVFLFCGICLLLKLTGCLSQVTQVFYKELTLKSSTYPSATLCKECHQDIYEEWKNSRHAQAYTSKAFQESTNGSDFKACLPCHIPDTLFSETLKARSLQENEGVTCTACHYSEGKFVGPIETSAIIFAHPIEVNSTFYRSSLFCGKCHESTYQEWFQRQQKSQNSQKTCQECHMSEVVRRATQGDNPLSNFIVSFEKEGRFKRHHFQLSEIENLSGAFEISLHEVSSSSLSKKIKLLFKNALPHSLPTGSFGSQHVLLKITFQDKNQQELGNFQEIYIKEKGKFLSSESEVFLSFNAPLPTTFLHIHLQRLGSTGHFSLYSKVLALP